MSGAEHVRALLDAAPMPKRAQLSSSPKPAPSTPEPTQVPAPVIEPTATERMRMGEEFDRYADDDGRRGRGAIKPTPRNIEIALSLLGVRVSYDLFAHRERIEGMPAEFGAELSDDAVRRLWLDCQRRFRFMVPKEFFSDVVSDIARANHYHPVRDYVDGLTWDGEERLDRWLTTYGGAENTPYTRAVGRLVLIAAVRRVRKPGVKFDQMLILESPQGLKKSTALAVLAGRPEWFSDSLPLGAGGRELLEATSGRWLVEVGELAGMSKVDVSSLKAYLSRTTDRARLPYAKRTVDVPREFLIVGTCNPAGGYLRDTTGNRRFWPVETKEWKIEALKRDRDQLWAEAVAAEATGEAIELDSKLWDVAAEEQAGREEVDTFEDRLADVLGSLKGKAWTEDLWRIVGIDSTRATPAEQKRFSAALHKLGWKRTRRRNDGGQRRSAYWRECDDEIEITVDFNQRNNTYTTTAKLKP